MLDLGMSELLVIGIVALIVIGPKDLPELFRSLGRFTAKMRGMAREFSRAMEAAADESGMKDVAKDLKTMTSAKSMGLDAMREATTKFEKWDPLKNAARPTPPGAKPALQPDPAAAAPAAQTAETAVVANPVPPPAMGPETKALADAKAERQAIVKEVAVKLKKPGTTAAAPAAKSAAKTAKPTPDPSKKPRAPRKPKSDKTPKADA
ncbi:MAG: Sec-independent protein translocase protein TatB [Paracoccaceae bacterium]